MATRTVVQQTYCRPTNQRPRGFHGYAKTGCDMRNNPVNQVMNHNIRVAPTQGRPHGHIDYRGPPRPMGAHPPFHQRLREKDRAVNVRYAPQNMHPNVRYAPQNMHQENTWAAAPNQCFNNSSNHAATRHHCPRASAPNHFGQGSQTQQSRNSRFQQRLFDGYKLTSLDLTYFDDVDLTPNQDEAPASKNSPQPAMGVYLDTAFKDYMSNDSYSSCTPRDHISSSARDGRDSNITRASGYITGDGKTVHVNNYVQITHNYTVTADNVVLHGTMNVTDQGNGGELAELDSNADTDARSDADSFDCDSATGGRHCVLDDQFEVNVTVKNGHDSVSDKNGHDSKGEGPTNVFDLESECRISDDIESDSSLHVYDCEGENEYPTNLHDPESEYPTTLNDSESEYPKM